MKKYKDNYQDILEQMEFVEEWGAKSFLKRVDPEKPILATDQITGMDKILLGQKIPFRSSILIEGNPGSGKTTLALQFLNNNKQHSPLYFTFEESEIQLRKNSEKIGWDFDEDLFVARRVPTNGNEIDETIKQMIEEVRKNRSRIVVFDSISRFREIDDKDGVCRKKLSDLFALLKILGVTVISLAETSNTEEILFEEYVADVVIKLTTTGLMKQRYIEFSKIRGIPFEAGQHLFEILEEKYIREKLEKDYDKRKEENDKLDFYPGIVIKPRVRPYTEKEEKIFVKLFYENIAEKKFNEGMVEEFKDRFPSLQVASADKPPLDEEFEPLKRGFVGYGHSNIKIVSIPKHLANILFEKGDMEPLTDYLPQRLKNSIKQLNNPQKVLEKLPKEKFEKILAEVKKQKESNADKENDDIREEKPEDTSNRTNREILEEMSKETKEKMCGRISEEMCEEMLDGDELFFRCLYKGRNKGRVAKSEFPDRELVQKLLDLEIEVIREDNSDHDFVSFNEKIKDEETLTRHLETIDNTKKGGILTIWRKSQEKGDDPYQCYIYPNYVDIGLLVFRKDLLRELGFENRLPETWQDIKNIKGENGELDKLNEEYKAHGKEKFWGFAFPNIQDRTTFMSFFWEFIWSFGGEIFEGETEDPKLENPKYVDKTTGKLKSPLILKLNSEDVKEALKCMQELIFKRIAPSPHLGDMSLRSVCSRQWSSAYQAMIEQIETRKEENDEFTDECKRLRKRLGIDIEKGKEKEKSAEDILGLGPIPMGKHGVKHYTIWCAWCLGIMSKALSPEIGWSLIEAMTSTEKMRRRAIKGAGLPAQKALYNDAAVRASNPNMYELAQNIFNENWAIPRSKIPHYNKIATRIYKILTGERGFLNKHYLKKNIRSEKELENEETVEEIMSEIEKSTEWFIDTAENELQKLSKELDIEIVVDKD